MDPALTAARGLAARLGEAEQAVQIAQADPAGARRAAAPLAGDADPEVRAVALRALGIAARATDAMPDAREHLLAAVAVAEGAGLATRAAEARLTLATVLALSGDAAEALAHAELAEPHLSGRDAVRLRTRKGLVLQRLGRHDEASAVFRRALAAARRLADEEGEAQILGNRSLLHAYEGRFAAAEADLLRARDLFGRAGQPVQASDALHDLGFVAARRGDVVTALGRFDEAAREAARHGVVRPTALLDRCEALLAAGLTADARRMASRAERALDAAGLHADRAEALLLLGEATLRDGDPEAALGPARDAADAFRAQGRGPWALIASHVEVRARWARGERGAALAEVARELADRLVSAGWTAQALEARLVAAAAALDAGHERAALADLERAAGARTAGPARLRMQAWLAEATLRVERPGGGSPWRALASGMRAATESAATAGATELRAHAAAGGGALVSLALRLAVASGRAPRVLAWAERGRMLSLAAPRALPPRDRAMAELLAELRHVAAAAERAAFAGAPDAQLARRQAAVEQRVRQRAWAAGGPGRAGGEPPAPAELGRALGDRRLVELVETDGRHVAVVVARGRCSMREVAGVRAVTPELESARLALARLARPGGSPAGRAAASRSLAHSLAALDELLLGPLDALTRDAPLVVVPTGGLHAVPWAALPSLRDRPATIAPSAALWLRAEEARRCGDGRVVLAAGPDLEHARAELAAVAAAHARSVRLTGVGATVRAVLGAIDGATVAHVAAHGTFRADNPLFSALRLADGPLTVYDLERLGRPPGLVVLSACDTGRTATRPGDAVMGFAASLLALGTSSVIASVAPVGDAPTASLMARLHARLARGDRPSHALAAAAAEVESPTGFVCLGAG